MAKKETKTQLQVKQQTQVIVGVALLLLGIAGGLAAGFLASRARVQVPKQEGPYADLAVQDTVEWVSEGSIHVEYRAVVQNRTETVSGPAVQALVTAWGKGQVNLGQTVLYTGAFGPGSSQEIAFYMPPDVARETYQFKIELDPSRMHPDPRQDNNRVVAINPYLAEAPDLGLLDISYNAAGDSPAHRSLQLTVMNYGGRTAEAVEVRVGPSDGQGNMLPIGLTGGNLQNIGDLEQDEKKQFEYRLLPDWTSDVYPELIVSLDPRDRIYEGDDGNENWIERDNPVAVVAPAPDLRALSASNTVKGSMFDEVDIIIVNEGDAEAVGPITAEVRQLDAKLLPMADARTISFGQSLASGEQATATASFSQLGATYLLIKVLLVPGEVMTGNNGTIVAFPGDNNPAQLAKIEIRGVELVDEGPIH